ncbi:hypothetical protein LAU42_03615 [Macrococcus armenti]|uniref:competence protein CoiA n=1 Tax=Macrococcus armenti TaxID=2875764 RepID=UPI001CCCDAFD|nr:competence protein CoiA family protein [Macrococcus armenti]UBH23035.1 hypothetical protein LAU42_03615 [Macrococcus armenti]
MIQAMNIHGEIVQAQFANKSDRYFCPVCQQQVMLKSGHVNVPHFAHIKSKDCFAHIYRKETAAHIEGKYKLYALFGSKYASMEYYLSEIEQIPDVYLHEGIALELQLSTIPAHLIESRTRGYQSMNINVCWIADYNSLNLNGNVLTLNYFQQSLIHYPSRALFTLNITTGDVYALRIIQVTGRNQYVVTQLKIESMDAFLNALNAPCHNGKDYVLNQGETMQYIRSCKHKRSVLEPTLSALYQLRIHHNDIPLQFRIVMMEQLYLYTHPMLWQLELERMVQTQSFTLQKFLEIINIHPVARCYIHDFALCNHILEKYYRITKQMRAKSIEK